MARVTKTIGFSVPPSMAEEFESLARDERRTKSELFREMLRLYRTYRQRVGGVDEERFDQLVERVLREAQENPMSAEEMDEVEQRLMRYGARKARELGIAEEDVDRIVYAERKKREVPGRP